MYTIDNEIKNRMFMGVEYDILRDINMFCRNNFVMRHISYDINYHKNDLFVEMSFSIFSCQF